MSEYYYYLYCNFFLCYRYEDAFNRFIDEINSVAAYDWWEGSVHSILSILAYPCSWSWKQWRQRSKVHRLQEYVKSEYDHSCLRSCRSRALYKGMKVLLFCYYLSFPVFNLAITVITLMFFSSFIFIFGRFLRFLVVVSSC